MSHVSKKPLSATLYRSLCIQLSNLVAKSDKRTAPDFLQELLTDTEQTMLAKRLAVIYMFHEGCSTYKVVQHLKMSTSTVMYMHRRYKDSEYGAITKVFGRSKADREKLWSTIELILRGGMPSMGKDRWSSLKD